MSNDRLRWFLVSKVTKGWPKSERQRGYYVSKNTGTIYKIIKLDKVWRGKKRHYQWHWWSLKLGRKCLGQFKIAEDAKDFARQYHDRNN